MTATTAQPATVKDAAAAIRKDLRAAYPDTKFSVRKGTGTASAWIDVAWTDGPNDDMVRNVTDRYEQLGSPVEGVFRERHLSKAVLLRAQELIRAVLPEFAAYDEDGRWVNNGPGDCPVFHLGGWRFGGGDRYSALDGVADLLILNPRKGPVA
jgi:conjugative element/phage-associated large polyvalent protein